ncbi:MAG: hypothetical protein JW742_01040 [Candidatus Aminicenantes bacterium]|nr:hypothetical protein [Candidatus Aminicenantes bacterium]
MNAKKNLIALGLILAVAAGTSSCKRGGVQSPSPVGPSTLATLLLASANPNVIYAGSSRGTTVITAVLKKFNGTPLADRTVYFEVGDDVGNKLNIGFFEDQPAVAAKVTDGTGTVRVVYKGPLDEEITGDGTIYIWVRAAWEGAEMITERVALQILHEPLETWFLTLAANPNVLVAGVDRQRSAVRAVLTKDDGSPIPNKPITFKVADETGTPLNIGYFDGHKTYITKPTDEQGLVSVAYFGPESDEITQSQTIHIWGTASLYGQDFVESSTPIQILQEPVTAWTLTLQAVPNVLIAGSTREESSITATLTRANGTPIANKDVTLKVADQTGAALNLGYFDGFKTFLTRTTDAQGRIRVRYIGPLATEIASSMSVYIWGTVGFEGSEFVEGNTPIQILQDLRNLSFDAAAYPNVLFATTSRPKSDIKATVMLGKVPIKGRRVYFSILNNAPGRFANGQRSAIVTTDAHGEASATYLGPLASEFNWEIGVYIRAQLETTGTEEMTFKDVYIRVKKKE